MSHVVWLLFAAVIWGQQTRGVLACTASECQGTRKTSTLQLGLRGVPSRLSPFELNTLKNRIAEIYSCKDGNRSVTGIQLRRDLSVDLSSSVRSTFSLVYEVDYTTNLCQDTFFLSDTSTPSNEDCTCKVPTADEFLQDIGDATSFIIGFVDALTTETIPRGINNYIDIEETLELEDCDSTPKDWGGTAAWTINQDLSMVTPEFTDALQQATLETFNGYSKTCDEQSRRAESVQISVRPVENANLNVGQKPAPRRNLRSLQDDPNTSSSSPSSSASPSASVFPSFSPSTSPSGSPSSFSVDLFTIVFSFDGSCRNCESDLGLFDQVKETGRQLDTSAACGCAPGKERRGQSAIEFLINLKERLSQIESLSFLATASGPFAEVRAVGCPAFNSFISFTSVTFSPDGPTTDLSDSERTEIGGGFTKAYNNLQARKCDPLFRILDSSQVIGTSATTPSTDTLEDLSARQRGLQIATNGTLDDKNISDIPSVAPSSSPSSSPTSFGVDLFTIVFLSTGTCAGCPSESQLFDQLSPTRRLLDSSSTEAKFSEDASFPLSTSRFLQDEETCFCRLDDEDGAPNLDEFVKELTVIVEDLTEAGKLNGTLKGAMSASRNSTTEAPSVSPSSLPSASPSCDVNECQRTTSCSLLQITLRGVPDKLGRFELSTLQDKLAETYACSNNKRKVNNLELRSDLSDDLFNPANTTFSLVYEVDYDTKICQDSFFQLDADIEDADICGDCTVPFANDFLKAIGEDTADVLDFIDSLTPADLERGIDEFVRIEELVSPCRTQLPSEHPSEQPSLVPSNAPTEIPTTRRPTGRPSIQTFNPTTPGATVRPASEPTKAPTARPTSNPTKAPTPRPTPTPTESIISNQPNAPTPQPAPNPTPAPTPDPTRPPTPQPTPNPTPRPILNPTRAPTARPTPNPTPPPTPNPTPPPTLNPTKSPTARPTPNPTPSPTKSPTARPTPKPTPRPTPDPTKSPTARPTPNPTPSPTKSPTARPTPNPTPPPTLNPTKSPTARPTPNPTPSPSKNPTQSPTISDDDPEDDDDEEEEDDGRK